MKTDDPVPGPTAASGGLGSLDPGELLARGLNTVQPTIGQGPWVPPEPEELARLLPQFQIERIIGHGGMGAVYQGVQTALERKVAIKLLPADLAMDAQFVARFQREARMLARLQHPGIVAVYDCGQSSAGHLYFVMEYVEGTDLQRVLREPGLEPAQAMELITQICDALQYAHRQGVIHRDIKPANILLGLDGRVKVADFGLARPNEPEGDELTRTNMVMGTPAYMAPEQRLGHADQRADIFALGVMLYEMLTGKRPHGAFDPPSHKVQVDVRIDSVVLKALQSEPERRYQEVSEMRSDVEQIRTTPLPVERPPEPARPTRKARWAWAIGALAAALALGWLLGSPQGKALWRPAPPNAGAEQSQQGTPAPPVRPTPPVVSAPDRLALEAALFGSDWLYMIGVSGVNSHELRFEPDHIVRTNHGNGATWHWWIVGPRSVHLQHANEPEQYDPQTGTNLTFDPSLKKFQGLTADGKHRQSGEAIPKEHALNSPATPPPKSVVTATSVPATPVPATPARVVVTSTPQAVPIPPWPAPGKQMSDVSRMKQIADIQFARGLNGFPKADDQRWKLGLINGEYQFSCRETGVWFPGGVPLANIHVTDFVCEIRARVFQNADAGWGLGMMGTAGGESHPWTGVMVDGAGMINTHSYDSGPAWPWQYSPAMRRGAEANVIRIEAVGDRVRVFANGVFVVERVHQRLRPQSTLALYAFGKKAPMDARVLSIQVWQPDNAATSSGLALARSQQVTSTPAPSTPTSTPRPPVLQPAVELLSPQNAPLWKTTGGIFRVEGGNWTTFHPQPGRGVAWYTRQTYSDFTLRLEFLCNTPTSNSGVFVRSPSQIPDPSSTGDGYEIQIYGDPKDPQPTGAIYGVQPPSAVPQHPGWNSLEVSVVHQNYTVALNGVVTNRFVGNRALGGYIGLQCHHGGPVKFRNVRITELR